MNASQLRIVVRADPAYVDRQQLRQLFIRAFVNYDQLKQTRVEVWSFPEIAEICAKEVSR